MKQHVKRFFAALFCVAFCLLLTGMSTGLAQAQTQVETQIWDMVKTQVNSHNKYRYLHSEYVEIGNRKLDYHNYTSRKISAIIHDTLDMNVQNHLDSYLEGQHATLIMEKIENYMRKCARIQAEHKFKVIAILIVFVMFMLAIIVGILRLHSMRKQK